MRSNRWLLRKEINALEVGERRQSKIHCRFVKLTRSYIGVAGLCARERSVLGCR